MDNLALSIPISETQIPLNHHDVSNTYLYGRALAIQRRQRVTKAVCSASQAGRFTVPDLHGAVFKNLPAPGAPTLDIAAPHSQRLATDANLTRNTTL